MPSAKIPKRHHIRILALTRSAATWIGFGAIVLWSLLALLTDLTGDVPPFQLAAMTFLIGGSAGLVVSLRRGRFVSALRQTPAVWALGIGGLFGYHFLYFSALRNAPPAEASLIAYLWPLLIVLISTSVTKEALKASHVIGAILGLGGAGLLITGPDGFAPAPEYARGYALALIAAFFWAGYSVLSRRVSEVPTDAVTGFCLVTALLAAAAHIATETTAWPQTATQWGAVLGLGLGPVGLAFFLWDIGVKRGDLAFLGAASYCAPLFSTLILVGVGRVEATWSLIASCLLITVGAVIAASSTLFAATAQTGKNPS